MVSGGSAIGDRWFYWTYPLATLAAHIAFIPFFALLLPRKVEVLVASGAASDSLSILSWILLGGALVASVAHIASGYIGDRWIERFGSRRGLIALGLGLLILCYAWLAIASTTVSMAAAVMAFQIALNVMLAPLGALLADYVPDESKGGMAGWINTALPLATMFTAFLTIIYPDHSNSAFWSTLAVLVLCCVPLLIFWPDTKPIVAARGECYGEQIPPGILRNDFAIAWVSRFCIQFGAAIMLGYLFAYLALHSGQWGFPATASEALGQLSIVAAGSGCLGALFAGYVSDFARRRLRPIAIGGLVVALSLAAIAWSESWWVFAIAYGAFHLGLMAFLTVDSALVATLLRGNRKRGTFLGVMNLTNTFPAVLGPVLTLAALGELSDTGALKVIISVAAVLALAASLLIVRVRSIR